MTLDKPVSDTTVRKSRRLLFWLDGLIPFLLLCGTVWLFHHTQLDIIVQQRFFDPQHGWFLKDAFIFQMIYRYSNIPALLLAIAGLVLFGLSWQAYKWAKWRKIGLFLTLAMLIGPGLVINTGLKDHWGRPRPRNTIDFGGKYPYEQILTIDASSPGLSFPCGHASMGFYLFMPWFILRKKYKYWALFSLGIGILAGMLIGLARIVQGAHYLSDVIIAGILVYLVGAGLFYLLKMQRTVWFYPKTEQINRRQRSIITLIVSILMVSLILGVILATPYNKQKSYPAISSESLINQPVNMIMNLPDADVSVLPADSLSLAYDVQGFGFPRSRLESVWQDSVYLDTLRIRFFQTRKGFFTELVNTVKVSNPFTDNSSLDLTLGKGSAIIVLPDSLKNFNLNIRMEKGALDLDLPNGFKPRISLKGEARLVDKTGFRSNDQIYIREGFRVNIVVVKGKVYLH